MALNYWHIFVREQSCFEIQMLRSWTPECWASVWPEKRVGRGIHHLKEGTNKANGDFIYKLGRHALSAKHSLWLSQKFLLLARSKGERGASQALLMEDRQSRWKVIIKTQTGLWIKMQRLQEMFLHPEYLHALISSISYTPRWHATKRWVHPPTASIIKTQLTTNSFEGFFMCSPFCFYVDCREFFWLQHTLFNTCRSRPPNHIKEQLPHNYLDQTSNIW